MNIIPIKKSLINSIKKAREETGISQAVLADLVGCTTGTIYRIESGTFLPNMELFLKILQALNLKIEISKN